MYVSSWGRSYRSTRATGPPSISGPMMGWVAAIVVGYDLFQRLLPQIAYEQSLAEVHVTKGIDVHPAWIRESPRPGIR